MIPVSIPTILTSSHLIQASATTWSRSAGPTLSQPPPSAASTFKSTSLHLHRTTNARCLPLANLLHARLLSHPLLPQNLLSINTTNPHRENRPTILSGLTQRQVREIRRLRDTLTPPLHDTRQFLARRSEVHVHWRLQDPRSLSNSNDA